MHKIFIIHGWTYTTDKWDAFVLQMKAAGFEAVMLKVPGLTEVTDKVWTLEDYVAWLDQSLANEQKPVLIGHSNGGRIAIAFAEKYPNKLGLLILVDSAGIYHNEPAISIKRAVFGKVAKLGKTITSSPSLRKILYKLAGESDYERASPQMRQTMANLISVDLSDKLVNIKVPTLIIWGRKDKATPLPDGELINLAIANSELYVIDKAGHSPHFSHPVQVSTKILEVIKKYGI